MIDKRELLDEAAALSLLPHVVEKDYALGRALAGIYAHPDLKDSWIFKGGTCLKKCFLETYRFSEDLDFTLTDPAHLDVDLLKRVFAEVSEWIYEATGFELPVELQAFDLYHSPRGSLSCQGKLSYAGPLAPPRSGGLPRVKLDLTADERIALDPVPSTIYHPYSDAPEGGIHVLAYAWQSGPDPAISTTSSICSAVRVRAPLPTSCSAYCGRSVSSRAWMCHDGNNWPPAGTN